MQTVVGPEASTFLFIYHQSEAVWDLCVLSLSGRTFNDLLLFYPIGLFLGCLCMS